MKHLHLTADIWRGIVDAWLICWELWQTLEVLVAAVMLWLGFYFDRFLVSWVCEWVEEVTMLGGSNTLGNLIGLSAATLSEEIPILCDNINARFTLGFVITHTLEQSSLFLHDLFQLWVFSLHSELHFFYLWITIWRSSIHPLCSDNLAPTLIRWFTLENIFDLSSFLDRIFVITYQTVLKSTILLDNSKLILIVQNSFHIFHTAFFFSMHFLW